MKNQLDSYLREVAKRRVKIHAMKQKGLTFREIGLKMGISHQRADQLYRKELKRLASL